MNFSEDTVITKDNFTLIEESLRLKYGFEFRYDEEFLTNNYQSYWRQLKIEFGPQDCYAMGIQDVTRIRLKMMLNGVPVKTEPSTIKEVTVGDVEGYIKSFFEGAERTYRHHLRNAQKAVDFLKSGMGLDDIAWNNIEHKHLYQDS